ncbi:flagellar hook-basal body complex protein FliE [Mesobacillus foraminis]|uniref:flagellar hook-basal body complex protein FliE n=1 Tax=Mesobacillus foraminis TaxID=279826 RepID=UPI001BEBAB9E|nr:flagellar hook-basal body complex protein FliE [Mesobacillus foraminis]MBT2756019.1 flagellar hook-basal body complex protein FliE [Mesobacillus foraminis]
MNIGPFNPVSQSIKPLSAGAQKINSTTPFEAQKSFASVLRKSLENLNETQAKSDLMTNKLANGENVDLHQVMIASQKASVTLQATLEVRNKVVEAYQEMMRMQV